MKDETKKWKFADIFIILILILSLGIALFLTLDLSERKVKKYDGYTKSQAGNLADAYKQYINRNSLSKDGVFNLGFIEVDSQLVSTLVTEKLLSSSFLLTDTLYISSQGVEEKTVYICFVPKSKYFRAGAEDTIVLENPTPNYLGVTECKKKDYSALSSSCVQCIKR